MRSRQGIRKRNETMGTKEEQIAQIQGMKKKHNAVILAHYYQNAEVQQVADFLGDSLDLSQKAADNDADVVVFCGVKFMAETAKILSPQKTVLLPREDAGCLMADMINADDIRALKEEHPDATVVGYVNTTAEVKALCDYCCTSANAVKLVRAIPGNKILFLPDRNLGQYIAAQVPEKTFVFAEGFCPTHHFIEPEDVRQAREEIPDGEILAHPECRPEVLSLVDFVGSTSQILKRARESSSLRIVVCTEQGILYKLQKDSPNKEFIMLSPKLVCPNMKKITLDDVHRSLSRMEPQIDVEDSIRVKALTALERMLQNV